MSKTGKMVSRMFSPGSRGTQESWVGLQDPTEKEREYLAQYQQLTDQLAATPGTLALNATDQALLDQAFAGAKNNLRRQGQIYAQDLAGTRGLNTSDTPVSDSVLRELLPATADIENQQALTGLNLGLQLRGMDFQKQQAKINAAMNLANREQQDRYARAKQYGTASQAIAPNGMQNAIQGMQALGMASGMFGGGLSALGGLMSGGLGLAQRQQPTMPSQSSSSLNVGTSRPFGDPYWMNYKA